MSKSQTNELLITRPGTGRILIFQITVAVLSLFGLLGIFATRTQAGPADYFTITVVDDQTGRGVPLVELTTTNEAVFVTDSRGVVAFNEPGLMDQTVYFRVKSHGYDVPADGFGNRGTALAVKPGGHAEIKIRRVNIAERLYRITGGGIYRDSALVGQATPTRRPLLNGQVMGQDTVEVTPYKGKIYWFWGDTNRVSYPLGQFATSGATSELPGRGGLDPSAGVDLTYWVDESGFSKKMIPLPGPGVVWVGGLFTVNDRSGQERLLTHYSHRKSLGEELDSGIAVFDDAKAQFVPLVKLPPDAPLFPEGHPFRATQGGVTYLYFQPRNGEAMPCMRVRADWDSVIRPAAYESFTCLQPGSRDDGDGARLDRAPDGQLKWAWKADTAPVSAARQSALIKAGKMTGVEAPWPLQDADTGATVQTHGGSVFWNAYRKRWVMIAGQQGGTTSLLGELWYAEADTPEGPWVYARKVVTHDKYTFYNPTQHPFFDANGGRQIYFEGTYTDTFSGVPTPTPRYNYNQIMYRLSLDDPRLFLPVTVYGVTGAQGATRYALREGLGAARAQSFPFFALPPDRRAEGTIPIYAAGGALQTAPAPGAAPLFYALPPTEDPKAPATTALLYEYRDARNGARRYATEPNDVPQAMTRAAQPLCRVWRSPFGAPIADFGATAAP